MVNYYQELNLDPNLKGEQLNDALRSLQRKWVGRTNAPDLNRRQEAERKVALIEEARKTLTDDNKRMQYDLQLKNSLPSGNETPSAATGNSVRRVEELIQQAWDLINSGRHADAILVARKATEMEGNNADAWAVLGYADYSWNNVQDAIYEYKKAISLKPNSDVFYCDLGNIYLDHNMLSEAEDCANRAIRLNPDNNYNKLLLGNIAANKNEYDKAIAIFSELLELEPDNESYKRVLGNSYYFKGISYCYQGHERLIYNLDETNTKLMIDCMKKASQYVDDPEIDEKIVWGESSLKKTFDKSKWTLFVIPVLLLPGGHPIIGILLISILLYFCIRPQWRINRNALLGEKTVFDYSALVITSTIGFVFSFAWGFVKGMLRAITRT